MFLIIITVFFFVCVWFLLPFQEIFVESYFQNLAKHISSSYSGNEEYFFLLPNESCPCLPTVGIFPLLLSINNATLQGKEDFYLILSH